MLKKYLYIFLWFLSSFHFVFAAPTRVVSDPSIQTGILPGWWNIDVILTDTNTDGFHVLDSLITFVKDSIFNLLLLISLGVFLYIWAKLVIARWNPEEFKKAMLSFVYAGVGLFIVGFAWAAVKLVSGLNF